ncbi:MAG: hypothetical protein IJ196_06545 [Prevotella sp.]|nr:hypothetical protein [Prevotella sp.]
MKKYVIKSLMLSCMLLCGVSAYGQADVEECFPVGTTWDEVVTRYCDYIDYDHWERVRFTVVGDTLIGGTVYKRVVREHIDGSGHFFWEAEMYGSYDYAIREDAGRVYLYGEYPKVGSRVRDTGEETCLYDFNWSMADGVEKMTLMDGNEYDVQDWVIRTIGSMNWGLLWPWSFSREPNILCLERFSRNGKLIYQKEFPDKLGIRSVSEDGARAPFYDLQGRRLAEEPQQGVYVKNGKKYVK